MEALRLVRQDPEPEVAFDRADEASGVRRMPRVEDDLPDLTDAIQDCPEGEPEEAEAGARRATPPPIPKDAIAQAFENPFDEVSLVDFEFLAKTCGPKMAGRQQTPSQFPAVPGIPNGFRVTPVPPAPRAFDYELALHVGVVWGTAMLAGIVALF